jgi:multisubunit Na+/H+ antiporter MnhG subunit
MPKFIERWWLRSVSRTECSPSILIAVAIVVLGLVVIKYQDAIIRTVVITLLAVVCLLAVAGLSMLAYTTVRWYSARDMAEAHRVAGVPSDGSIVDVPDDITEAHSPDEEAAMRRARKLLTEK